MAKKQLTDEQKRADVDLWMIILVTFATFGLYSIMRSQILRILKFELNELQEQAIHRLLEFGEVISVSDICKSREIV